MTGNHLGAQAPSQAAANAAGQSGARDTLTAQLATITTDTGDLAPGHTNFAHYDAPGLCRNAALSAARVADRALAAQAVMVEQRKDPLHDTLPTAVVRLARTCGARFTIAKTPDYDLPDLFELALVAGTDSLAEAVLRRQLVLAGTDTARLTLLKTAITTYLTARPARVAAAERAAAQGDALKGPLDARLHLRMLLSDFYDTAFDRPEMRQGMRHEIDQLLRLARTAHPTRADTAPAVPQTIHEIYWRLAKIVTVDYPDSAAKITEDYRQLMQQWPATSKWGDNFWKTLRKDLFHTAATVQGPENQIGRPTQRLRAAFWFPATDTVQPVPGKISLFVLLPTGCYDGATAADLASGWGPGPASVCREYVTAIRRWRATYPSADLAITLVATATRFVLLRGPLTPAQAAGDIQWFVQKYLNLPVALAVQPMQPYTDPLPAPDGRIFALDDAKDSYANVYGHDEYVSNATAFGTPAVVLTDRTGKEVYAGALTPFFDVLFRQTLVASPVAVPLPTPPGKPTTVLPGSSRALPSTVTPGPV